MLRIIPSLTISNRHGIPKNSTESSMFALFMMYLHKFLFLDLIQVRLLCSFNVYLDSLEIYAS